MRDSKNIENFIEYWSDFSDEKGYKLSVIGKNKRISH